MFFSPYVFDSHSGKKISVDIEPATQDQLYSTHHQNQWQTDWTSTYLSDPSIDKFAILGDNDEIIGLGAYQAHSSHTHVTIIYGESAPSSNPTMHKRDERKYSGIGRLLVAFGIKYSIDHGCLGVVVFEAKTDELAAHYEKDFCAVRIPTLGDGIKRYMLADDRAWNLFSKYLEEVSE